MKRAVVLQMYMRAPHGEGSRVSMRSIDGVLLRMEDEQKGEEELVWAVAGGGGGRVVDVQVSEYLG